MLEHRAQKHNEATRAPATAVENDWPPEKRERVNRARTEWEALIKDQESRAPMLEQLGAKSVSSVLSRGNPASKNYDPETFESRAVRKRVFTDEDVIWLVWPGLNSADSGQRNFFLEGSASAPGSMDSLPRQGTSFVFHGPTAIAGYTPEQLMRAMDQVLEDSRLIIKSNPGKKICMYGFSGGTAPAVYVANQIGLEQGQAIDKLILAAGGDSMAYGLFRTYATKEVAKSYLDRGITVEEFHKAIEPYTQMHNIKALPAGRNLLVHAGSDDHVVEMDLPHGTNEFVRRLQRAGKDPAYTIHQNRNHASVVLSLMAEERLGLDPFGLRTPQSVWEQDSAFRDPALMRNMEEVLSVFSNRELQDMATYLAGRKWNGVRESDMRTAFSPPERAIVYALVERDICQFALSPRDDTHPAILSLKEPAGLISPIEKMKRRFTAVENLTKTIAATEKLNVVATSAEAQPVDQTIDIVEEIKKLGFPSEAYCVVIDGAMAVRSDEHLTIVARDDLFESLRGTDWNMEKEGYFSRDRYRVYRDFNGEDFVSLGADRGMVDGIPAVNRTSREQEEAGGGFTFENAA